MNIMYAAFTEDFFSLANASRNLVRCFNDRSFDIDDTKTDPDFWIQASKKCNFRWVAARHFKNQMAGMQIVHEGEKPFPSPFLNRLSSVISKANVHSFAAWNG